MSAAQASVVATAFSVLPDCWTRGRAFGRMRWVTNGAEGREARREVGEDACVAPSELAEL